MATSSGEEGFCERCDLPMDGHCKPSHAKCKKCEKKFSICQRDEGDTTADPTHYSTSDYSAVDDYVATADSGTTAYYVAAYITTGHIGYGTSDYSAADDYTATSGSGITIYDAVAYTTTDYTLYSTSDIGERVDYTVTSSSGATVYDAAVDTAQSSEPYPLVSNTAELGAHIRASYARYPPNTSDDPVVDPNTTASVMASFSTKTRIRHVRFASHSSVDPLAMTDEPDPVSGLASMLAQVDISGRTGDADPSTQEPGAGEGTTIVGGYLEPIYVEIEVENGTVRFRDAAGRKLKTRAEQWQ
ncbi:hypothetical protein MFIFM68171_02518 [Madurella fahalii]|uniref:Zn(2)-C6 fungal-type domain-containing protein n=1 Tax=Madurella fahalii TaxID=1157608 RepID=A0ABQ0G3H0_9PEZI